MIHLMVQIFLTLLVLAVLVEGAAALTRLVKRVCERRPLSSLSTPAAVQQAENA